MAITMTMGLGMTAVATAACNRDIGLLPVPSGDGAAHPDLGAGADASDASRPALDGGGMNRTCAGLGDPIHLPTATGPVCTSALAARGGRFALCSCDDLEVTAPIHTDSFDSNLRSTGGDAGVGSGAAIGCNGILSSSAPVLAGGPLYVASGIATTGHLDIARSFRTNGAMVIINTDVHVGGDAFVGGSISGILRVDGTLHLPPGAGVDPALMIPETSIRREAISVAPPCDCGSAFVDLGLAIASAVAVNDNALVGLSMDALAALKATTAAEITCGVYVLSAIDAQQPLILIVRGRALLVVTGDVALRGGLSVLLDPGAELDLLVGGRLMASGGNAFGSAAPARFRVWIAGADSVVFDGAPAVGAMIRAPNAAITASSGLRLSGGLVARSVISGAELDVHFDEAVLSSGMPCGEPTATAVP
jgi:hypothetical protein